MGNKLVLLPGFLAAFLVLFVSIYRTASVKYVFSQEPSPAPDAKIVTVDYGLPDPEMTPENPLWPARAFVDRIHASVTASDLERAALLLQDADLRLVAGLSMYERGKIEDSFVVLAKAEGYLLQSYETAYLSHETEQKEMFLHTLAHAALKHREILETIMTTSPEDARAVISRLLDTPKSTYDQASGALRDRNLVPPPNPF